MDIQNTTIEEWKDIPNFPGYKLSNQGRVISYWHRIGTGGEVFSKWRWGISDQPKPIAIGTNGKGYLSIQIQFNGKQKLRLLHQLLLETFVGPRPIGMIARHLNDVRTDNRLDNLAWGTNSQNMQDKMLNGKCRKLHPNQIIEIRSLAQSGLKQSEIGRMYGIDKSLVSRIASRQRSGYIE